MMFMMAPHKSNISGTTGKHSAKSNISGTTGKNRAKLPRKIKYFWYHGKTQCKIEYFWHHGKKNRAKSNISGATGKHRSKLPRKTPCKIEYLVPPKNTPLIMCFNYFQLPVFILFKNEFRDGYFKKLLGN
jgi:hypothetical protein